MDRIRLKVLGLSYSMSQAGAYALILADEQDMHRIPIVIGMPEAQSIAIQLEKMQTQRPLQVTLKEAFIYRLDSGIFYSELLFEKDTQQIKIDSRTSDAIALALRYDCPIYSTPEIVEKAGIAVGQETGQTESPEKEEVVQQPYSVQELTRMLDEAVRNEEYEKASKIRDLLKEMGK